MYAIIQTHTDATNKTSERNFDIGAGVRKESGNRVKTQRVREGTSDAHLHYPQLESGSSISVSVKCSTAARCKVFHLNVRRIFTRIHTHAQPGRERDQRTDRFFTYLCAVENLEWSSRVSPCHLRIFEFRRSRTD